MRAASSSSPRGSERSCRLLLLVLLSYPSAFPPSILQASRLTMTSDPVFEDHCAPVTWLGNLKRYSKPPTDVASIPCIDAVFISHSHYDHLSHPTVLEIQRRHPNAHFFVGLGLEKWFRKSGITNVTEMDWWEGADISLTRDKTDDSGPATMTAHVSSLPCQHGSGRSPFDQAHTLWCSWGVSSGGKSVYFAGDTGYRAVPRLAPDVDDYGPDHADLPSSPLFKQIGQLRGPFDVGLIPIGAYAPRHIMSGVHANPYDAVNIFADTRCRSALAIHWGTWVLTSEDVLEPPRLLRQALAKKGIAETGVFDVCDFVGQSREL
jgi:N-acyl-phosphatidylethanolamine-hydrolysing phospholipase D